MRANSQKGMSLPEVLVAIGIVAVMIFATMTVISTALHTTHNTNDKQFATQKAISMLEEMKSLVQNVNGTNVTVLDDYDDGVGTLPVLTIQNQKQVKAPATPIVLTLPDDAISGNIRLSPTLWTYERRISVQLVPGQANDVRLVNVKVFKNTTRGLQLLAEVASVIRTVVTNMPPTQVYDVYCIAIENVPGWWVYMSNVVPFVKNAINDLQARNPGLVFRTHWITTLAYGRDQEYRPFINNADGSGNVIDSTQDINNVYFYPGSMPTIANQTGSLAACCGDDYYYYPAFFRGHMLIDSTDTNGYDAVKNQFPYAIADQYNHAMRYVDERALYDARYQASGGTEEMTYRILLEEMSAKPWLYKNALMINLHGELLPFPPIRNYSDPAKNPEQTSSPNLTNVRVVTHPEQLRYTKNDSVNLRVYSYLANGATTPTINPTPIKLRILFGPDAATGTVTPGKLFGLGDVKVFHGGVDQDGVAGVDAYDFSNAPKCPASPSTQMCFTSSVNGNESILTLYNSPLISPQSTTGGLPSYARLYGLEYIPSPMEDLTTTATAFVSGAAGSCLNSTSNQPKNTARWVITIPKAAMPDTSTVTIETRLGDQLTSGVLYPPASRDHPANLSTTYFWRGDDNYVFGNLATLTPPALPMTERYQFLGDPRHLPYADLKKPHLANAFPAGPTPPKGSYESALGMGYNRYFDDFEDGTSNRAAAELISTKPENYVITNTTKTAAFKINGGTTFSVTLNVATQSASQICTTLNANGTFSGKAYCDVVGLPTGNSLRITSKTAGTASSVQFDTATGTAETILGFDGSVGTTPSWDGWLYSNGGWNYGIKNDGTSTNAGWDSGSGLLQYDIHRLFQTVRTALISTNAVWTTMTGFSYYYVGIGNEIGYDSANNFPNSVPVSTKPYTGTGGSWQWEDTILGTVKYIKENKANGWWAMPWLGELYPDSSYVSSWMTTGNLPTGSGTGTFIRTNRSNFPTFSGTKLLDGLSRTAGRGSTTLFWTGSTNSTFHHTSVGNTDTSHIQTSGQDIADNYAFPVPADVPSARPFDINVDNTGYNPENFLEPGVYPAAYSTAVLNQYFKYTNGPPYQGSSLITLTDPANYNVSFIAVNGLSPTGTTGTSLIARWSFLSLIQSYLNGGLYTDSSGSPTAHHIRQVPRLTISDPNINTNLKDPSTIKIDWTTKWLRWDGLSYTSAYPAGYSEPTVTLLYQAMYSPSNGNPDPTNGNPTGWFYVNSSPPVSATPGLLKAAYQKTAGPVTWNTPSATFAEGNYLIRVEAYRKDLPLHYAFHQYRAYIQR